MQKCRSQRGSRPWTDEKKNEQERRLKEKLDEPSLMIKTQYDKASHCWNIKIRHKRSEAKSISFLRNRCEVAKPTAVKLYFVN